MTDALDRAADAARMTYLTAPRTRGMDPLPLWRPTAAAALLVMADDIRRRHRPLGGWDEDDDPEAECEFDGHDWPCAEERTMRGFVGRRGQQP